MGYLAVVLQRLRLLLIALFWPLALLVLDRIRPGFFGDWNSILDLAALALAGTGALLAAGFAQWRLTHALVLIVLAGLGSHFGQLPYAAVVLPVIGLGLLPWCREAGWNGPAGGWVFTLVLVILALWWREGEPALRVEQWLRFEFAWRGRLWSPLTLFASTLAAAVLARLLIRALPSDLALGGTLVALMSQLPQSWPLPRVAATAAAVLAVWTGLLLHAWRLAYRDELTELPNRRALEDALRSRPTRWSLGMLDVDHFKKFNDHWGHDVGDQVLRRVAAALARVGERGRAFRYGGEEFAILFPHDDTERAAAALEAVRAGIADTPFRIRGQRDGAEKRGQKKNNPGHTITVSAGLARGDNDSAGTFKRADDALYKAKKKGRNRLVRDQ